MNNLEAAADLVMQYERWRDANPQDRLDPVLGPEIQLDIHGWAEEVVALLSRILEREDTSPFVAADTALSGTEAVA